MMINLSPEHYRRLSVESGISDDVIRARGYYTATESKELLELGFTGDQARVPALVIPLHQPKGQQVQMQIRPDLPRYNGKRKMKYEYIWNAPPVLDTPPVDLVREAIENPLTPLLITEGSKKADSAVSKGLPCLSIGGVWNWRGKNEFGGKMTIPDMDDIPWNGRPVYLCFDNDVMEKAGVYSALIRFAGVISNRGAKPKFVFLPYTEGQKIGLDDFLVRGGQPTQLFDLSSDTLKEPVTDYYRMNDMGIAHRIHDVYPDEMVYDNTVGTWFVWNNGRWTRDRQGNLVKKRITDHVDILFDEARGLPETDEKSQKYKKAFSQYIMKYGNARSVGSVEEMLRVITADNEPGFDCKPELLNCSNGTLDLRTGEFRGHRPSDRLTVMSPTEYDSKAECPMWDQFMAERFPQLETRQFVQKMCGLFVTGYSPEKAFFIVRGDKDCGKTVAVETIQEVLGAYGNKVDKETLMRSKTGKTQVENSYELVGKRMVFVDESDSGDKIDEAFIKGITGGDATIKARRLYEQQFAAKAEFTLILATNYRPRITGDDDAVWRRCHLIEFGKSIPLDHQIKDFKNLLMKESSGILRWMVEGYWMWKREGLNPPPEVIEWTQIYRLDNDPLGRFIHENYETSVEGEFAFANEVHAHFLSWCLNQDIKAVTLSNSATFGKKIRQRYNVGDGSRRVNNLRVFEGFKIMSSFREY